ncbi:MULTISPECIES: HAD family hydrolase [Staphylococcus]|jgi:putative hydrolase of the HAD superfamily|uniref:HAD family hydrolase n=2 Tax=Staphylococcus TaxID=1279 RepID=A0A133Q0Q6_STALU|nr:MULTISPECIES: HAD family hydrolase [Staphylococcus]ADC88301.1 L-2-haloalkanoic acid dehalogenase [Staphylococcus lugdunensis HKU09-01]AMG61398.1 HAD family hydrolase [Staphylococcus lugdunensis]AMG64709.1 HAD family hydrolase [Staphylococcus lugdunensis]ARB78498.1 HAD family hydrolase [Staphylococcus lugdunensis]ARJ10030.1 HAD family hydrolase [Staphylococcus lugdunensis]
MDLSGIKAVVFDLEGTLLDRKKSRDKFIEEQYERFHDYFVHVQLADFKKTFIELDDDEDNDKPNLYKEIIKQFHIDRLTWKDLFRDFEMHFYRYVFPYYDTLYTLEQLTERNYLTGVIANGKSKIKQFRLHSLGIEHVINYLSTSEMVGYRKPHPKIFEDMIAQLGVTPNEMMYVGDDALNDVAPARAMGMVSVWFKQEDAEIEPLAEEVDYTITTIEEILDILPQQSAGKGE